MHRYERRWPEDTAAWALPSLDDFRFRDALDVARYAELDPVLAWRTWPETWHLDRHGALQCSSAGSSLDSVRTYAENPGDTLRCRFVELDEPCPDRWVVIEPRHPWQGDGYRVGEDDARAFLALRRGLAQHGVVLLDVMVFDQEFHWWSLNELTSGSTLWR